MSETEASTDPIQVALAGLTDEVLEALRRTDLGPFGFTGAIRDLEIIRDLTQALTREDTAYLPTNFCGDVSTYLSNLETELQLIRDFDPEQQQAPGQVRDEIERRIGEIRNWFVATVKPQLRVGALEWAAMSAKATEAANEIETSAAEAQRILSDLRTRAGETVAEQLSDYYRQEAKDYSAEAKRNFRLTLASLILVAAIAALAFWIFPINVPSENSRDRWEDLLRGLVPRLLFLGLAAYALTFFSRNYRTARHLQTVNEHKRNALDTYGLFVSTVTDAERDLITGELVRRVFENPDTGWITHESAGTVIEAPTILNALRPPVA